jgi:molybdopterin-containing oxidoreductase family iron-sulfur binding subunit
MSARDRDLGVEGSSFTSPEPDEVRSRDLTLEDVLQWQGMALAIERRLDEEGRQEGEGVEAATDGLSRGSCMGTGMSCTGARPDPDGREAAPPGEALLNKPMGRRKALGTLFGTLVAGSQAACADVVPTSPEERERLLLEFQERIKGSFRLMTDEERTETIGRLERLARLKRNVHVNLSGLEAQEGVLFGYAFNISKCKGYRECVEGCLKENNQDRRSGIQYIRIFEMEGGEVDFEHANAEYQHEVPREGHVYLGTQCFQCANPPCVEVCPVAATWAEPDGIVVIDYDWCIGCRYCIAACPYWARRFNWAEPYVPAEVFNPNQHYLGNRLRRKGCVEKCMFCVQRTRVGRLPACAEACPTGARTFGNLLDPDSEIRWILENKQVFRLKADLGTEPRFWYYMD